MALTSNKVPPSLYLNDIISQNDKNEKQNDDFCSSSDERRDRVQSLRASKIQVGIGLQQQSNPHDAPRSGSDPPFSVELPLLLQRRQVAMSLPLVKRPTKDSAEAKKEKDQKEETE